LPSFDRRQIHDVAGLPKPGQPDSGESGHNKLPASTHDVIFDTQKTRHSTAASTFSDTLSCLLP